jgi:hypothetical protein
MMELERVPLSTLKPRLGPQKENDREVNIIIEWMVIIMLGILTYGNEYTYGVP